MRCEPKKNGLKCTESRLHISSALHMFNTRRSCLHKIFSYAITVSLKSDAKVVVKVDRLGHHLWELGQRDRSGSVEVGLSENRRTIFLRYNRILGKIGWGQSELVWFRRYKKEEEKKMEVKYYSRTWKTTFSRSFSPNAAKSFPVIASTTCLQMCTLWVNICIKYISF